MDTDNILMGSPNEADLAGETLKIISHLNGNYTMQRKYLPTLGQLLDFLTIAELKHAQIPEHRQEYAKEIELIVHDINLILTQTNIKEHLTAEYLRDVIILAQFNTHIWTNEANARDGEEGENRLRLTHSLNGIRNTAKNRLSKPVGGRQEYKIDCLAADAEHWKPSGY